VIAKAVAAGLVAGKGRFVKEKDVYTGFSEDISCGCASRTGSDDDNLRVEL
jgi:hypothetical protein